jgi:amino acid adenylation domain-containing protein
MLIPELVSDKTLTLHGVFEAQVEKTPEAIALVFEREQLTYRELNERANQLAHYLRSLNVAPEMLVGICLERSIEMIVGMLGILKAGGAFVPLDPSQPQERKAFILADTKVEVLLTLKKLVAGIPVPQSHLVCLDTEYDNIATKSKNNPKSGVQSDNLAYTIYTSGSTGKPKGVMVNHQAICQGFLLMQEIFPITPQDRILQKMPLTFDFSFWELFWPLMTGACVVLAQPGGEKDSAYLVKLIAQQEISVLVFVPSVLQVFLSEEGLKSCKNIRMVFTSGEPLTSALKDRFFNRLPNCQLYELFGATENIIVTYWSCQPGEKLSSFPQGRPFPNLSLYVVDEQLQPVPVGETGELLVGGWGLARGYLNRKELTAQKFISNPFKENSQECLYRTGDKVRYLSDGTIEIIGRIDNQVKIRGFRIELGEIEEKLSQHPAVKQIVVIAREDVPGDKRLVAYVVLHSSQESEPESISELRHFLKQQLPDYMIPSSFVVLEALPLNPNGKVDRRALPVPEIRPADLPTFVAPRTPIEEMLASIWANILRVEQVGIHDNFFELGGHSLLAAQIIARMRDSLGVELPFSRLLEFPTVAGLVKIVEEARQQEVRPIALPIQPMKRNQTIPLSFSQEQLWFLHQLTPEEPVYNEPCTIRFSGAINVDALEKALNEIIKRHESLRTRFITVDGQPVQAIAPPDTFNLPVMDLRVFPQELREAEALRIATKEAKLLFDLTTSRLLRATLMQLGDFDYRLFLTFHHIITDGVSIYSVFLKELAALYEAFSTGRLSPLAPLPVQYADFAVWQRQWLTQEILESQLDYWKQQLADLPVLQLPYDHPRPKKGTFRGARQSLVLSFDLTQALKTLSQQEGVTLYMTLLAAFKTLLYRYTGQDDIVVGTFSANRNRPELEGLIGYFLNTLVLRTDMSGTPSFRELLGRVRQVTLGAYAHEDLPFEKLVQTLQPERNLSQNPLFQVAFAPQPPMPSLNSEWTINQLDIQTDTAKFDLLLDVEERPEGIIGRLEYNTDLFDANTISRMIGHFQTILAGIVTNREQRVSELPLLTEQEQHQLLFEWNNTTKEYPQDKCIHQLFEEQVERSPDAVAVVFEGEQLTYRELNARANQLAHYLQTLGVGSEVLVGICMERSLEMVVGLLGILKAGGAYVPLDPAYPRERLAFMLEDTQTPVLLTKARLVESLPQHQARVVCLDTDWEVIARQSEENPTSSVLPDNLAYIIYTSGSTGKPKGVAVPHKAVNRLVFNTNYINLQPLDVVAQVSNCSFDAATFEILGALLNGARLVVITKDVALSPKEFADQLREQGITVLFLTTALFNLLAREVPSAFSSVQHLLFGGEAVELKWVKEVLKNGSPQRLLHVYGPTESTTFTTWYLVQDVPEGAITIPIGCPISNTQVYLLDEKLQLVPIGVPGELYVGGDGLARGYLNRPDLTAQKFIKNPFSNESGSRLYKTGDLARYLPDGNIEYLSRIDHQVKIRGFRIELGEIEAVLSQHPGVRETVVIAKENIAGDKQLVAYIVPHQEPVPTNSDLRRFLKEQLPEYMVPSAFVTLESLPLTPNGKVDRRALPEPELRPELELTFVAPRTPIEEMLASTWACVLGIEQVGVHNNFFELGGHSLLATQVISRVRDTLAVELPLRSLFEAPTVASLAAHVENSLHSGSSMQAEPLLPIPRSGDIPLSFAQARLWFLDQLQPNSAFYNIPIALRLSGQLNVAAIESSLNEIIRRHEVLRTNFTKVSGQPVQVIASTLKLKLLQVDLQNLPKSEREIEAQRLATTEAERPFDLEREPLVRATVIQLGSAEYVFVLTAHHIIFDGWSVGVFYGELAALYEAFCTGKPKVLPELPVQYADFAVWKRHWLTGEILETQLNYWKQQLDGAPGLLELPADRPRPAVQTFRGAHQYVALPVELSEALANLSRRTGVTLFMTLYAAFGTLLYRYTGSSDIVVGTPVANRNRQEIEGLIGFFVNTLVLRTDLSGNPSFEQLLRRVREVTLGAYAHQDLPFEELVEALKPTRSLSHTPLFQVMFALQNAPMPSMELPDLTVSSFSFETPTAKFDLTLSMENTTSGLIGVWEYNSDLFDAATIARMTGHFQTLLEALVANPQQRVSELPLLTEAERQQMLVEWNNTTKEYPQDKCIHQLFEEQVERSPNAVAVVFEGKQLTYRELNARANQLAHYLLSLGVGPEVLVGICVDRSLEMVVGLLGILKAGGAYVPLDPAYPPERLAFMLEDASVSVLLTKARLVESLPQHQARTVYLDGDWEASAHQVQSNLISGVTPDNLAYVIYTSGSTGRPKGVAIEHHSAVALLAWAKEIFASEDFAGVLASTSICFDLSVFELFVPLSWGGKVILAENALSLSTLPAAQEVTLINTVPSAIAELVRAKGVPASARIVNLAGEPLHNQLVQQIYQQDTIQQVFNLYGPSEDTTYSTFALVKKGSSIVTIGCPIANTQIYLLDEKLQPVPIGVPGELYIGGDGLARGYLNRPDLTAEKFIPNPFSNEPGSRLYKTGDLACYLPDGNIKFIGRIDNQVKIRGFRIELGEIEAVLAQHPDVLQAVVIVREDNPGNKYLAAYLVPKLEALSPASPPTISELRSFLKAKLPDYMIPGAFVFLEAMPLTPNGKIDRRALPAPDTSHRELEDKFVAPSTPTEEIVAAIWAEVLGLQQVGINDNFFDLGGHSLLATQIISRIREAFKIELPLRHLFEAPTIASLGHSIETAREAESQEQSSSSMAFDTLPPLVPGARDTHIPLSFAQKHIWIAQQFYPDSCAYNSPIALRFTGKLSPEVLEKSINEIIRRHEILRTTFPIQEEQPVQVIAPSLTLPLKIVDLQHLPLEEREASAQRLANQEAQHHFDLASGPVLQTTLIRLTQKEHWLLITMHHIITDGWSYDILLQELGTLYNAFSNGLPSLLPEVPFQYADFTFWQRQWLNEEVLQKQFSYWLQKLADIPLSLDILPPDWPQPSTNSRRASFYSIVLPYSLVTSMEAVSRSQGVTIFVIILTALKILLFNWSGQTDIIVLAATANRSTPEIEKMLGCFINDVILRSQVDGSQTGLAFLEQVKTTVSEAISNQDIPFEKVIELLSEVKSLRTVGVSMTPSVHWHERILNCEVASVALEHELWDEELLLELYISSPTEDSKTIEIGGYYSTDFFKKETIEHLFSSFQGILQQLVLYPETQLSEFDMSK